MLVCYYQNNGSLSAKLGITSKVFKWSNLQVLVAGDNSITTEGPRWLDPPGDRMKIGGKQRMREKGEERLQSANEEKKRNNSKIKSRRNREFQI